MEIRQQKEMLNIVLIETFNGCFERSVRDCSRGFVKAAFHGTVLFVHHTYVFAIPYLLLL